MGQVGRSKSVQVPVHAPPDVVYELLSDPTRMPQWSPEVVRVRWLERDRVVRVGARFRGTNRARLCWSRVCEVTVAEPPHRFAFRTVPTWLYADSTLWSFEVAPTAEGCAVTQRYEVVRGANLVVRLGALINGRSQHLEPNLRATLEALRDTAERMVPTAGGR